MKRVILCLGLFACLFLALQTFTFAAGCSGGKCMGSAASSPQKPPREGSHQSAVNVPQKPPRTEFHQATANIPQKPPILGGGGCSGGKCMGSLDSAPQKPLRTEFHQSTANIPQKPPILGGGGCSGGKCMESGVNSPPKPPRFDDGTCKGGKCIGSATNIEPYKPPLNNGSSLSELNHNPQVWHGSSNDLGSHLTENKPDLHHCPPGSKCASPTVTYKK